MARARLYINYPFISQEKILLSESHIHYLLNVLRLKEGSMVLIFHETLGEFETVLSLVSKKKAYLYLKKQTRSPLCESSSPSLLFSPLKQGPMDFLLEKATELGVKALYPVTTQHTVIHKINDRRLQALIQEASEQSERLTLPRLHPLQPLTALLNCWPQENIIYFCDEKNNEKGSLLKHFDPHKSFSFLIGPEGGFSEKERTFLSSFPFIKSINLGETILRAETAALAALSFSQLYLSHQKE